MANNYGDREYATGIWNGEPVRFNRVFGNHRFSDDEVEQLLNGEYIEFKAVSKKTGKPYTAYGNLKNQSFTTDSGDVREYVGFALDFDANPNERPPYVWAKHEFTDNERLALERGEVLHLTDCESSSGNTFACDIVFDIDEETGRKRIMFAKN